MGLTAVSLAVAAAVTYMTVRVPIVVVPMTDQARARHLPLALAAFVAVAAADMLAWLWARNRRDVRLTHRDLAVPGRPTALRLTFEHVSSSAVLVTAVVSATILLTTAAIGLPLWAIATFTLLPWVPVYFSIARWQYARFGSYAVFCGMVLLQLGHLGEHVAQNAQLLLSHGNLAMSSGIFGSLNQETVHFVWNIAILVGTAYLLTRVERGRLWLWISFAIASFHTVEHVYLFAIYVGDHAFWARGGSAGIFARGGLMGLPLARPYLHLVYNYLEIAPFVIAFWDESRRPLQVRPERPRPPVGGALHGHAGR